MSESWQCPYCLNYATLTESEGGRSDKRLEDFLLARGEHMLSVVSVLCPNPNCTQLTLSAELKDKLYVENTRLWATIQKWQLLPESNAKPFPDYIPEPIRKDYAEACRIKDLSPNAAATLARRCLQGMVRNFHKVEKSSLQQEFEEIKKKVTPQVWHAIEGVRKIGAIGAHMEENVNVMVDVEPEEKQVNSSGSSNFC